MILIGGVIILIILTIVIMENIKTSAKDFFLHLGTIVTLYAVTISFLNLIFKIINKAFPEVTSNIYAWGGGSEISVPVAFLIVVFPLFIVLSRFVYKIYVENPAKKELSIRKWLVYITLFVAGVILTGDLVWVIYKFLDGQDLTTAFLLKALTVLIVAGCVFGFYLQDLRERISPKGKKIWTIVVSCLILAAIASGFSVFGSPKTQRLLRYDDQKVSDLQNIQWQVISYWQVTGKVPASLSEINSSQQYAIIPTDPQTKTGYEYRKTEDMTFELCADFNTKSVTNQDPYMQPISPVYGKGEMYINNNWNHGVGRQCFTRVIDPTLYPTQVRG